MMSDDPWSDDYIPLPSPQHRKSRSVNSDLSDDTVEDPKDEIETFIREENEPESVQEPYLPSSSEPSPFNIGQSGAFRLTKQEEESEPDVPFSDDTCQEEANDIEEPTTVVKSSPFGNCGSNGFAGRGAFSGRGSFGRSDGDQNSGSTFGQSSGRGGFNIRGGFSVRGQSAESSTFGQRNGFGKSDDQSAGSTFGSSRGFSGRGRGFSRGEESGFGTRGGFGSSNRNGGFGNSENSQDNRSGSKNFGGGFNNSENSQSNGSGFKSFGNGFGNSDNSKHNGSNFKSFGGGFGKSENPQGNGSSFKSFRGGFNNSSNPQGNESGFKSFGSGFGNSDSSKHNGSSSKGFGGGFNNNSANQGGSTSFGSRGGFSGRGQSTESSNFSQTRGGGFISSFGRKILEQYDGNNQNTGSSFGSCNGRGGFGNARGNSEQNEGSSFRGRGAFAGRSGFGSSSANWNSENNRNSNSDGFRSAQSGGRVFSSSQFAERRNGCSQSRDDQAVEEDDPSRAPRGYEPNARPVDEVVKEDEENADEYANVCQDDEDLVVTGYNGEDTRIDKWNEAGFPDELVANILRSRYNRPRKIQAAAIALIRDGYDIKGHAETGSGKTAAYLLPIIAEIAQRKGVGTWSSEVCSPLAIIIGPTRELVLQVYEQAMKFVVSTGVTVAKAYGQYSPGKNARDIREGCDILCATTGRLKHFVDSGDVRCANVKYLVLDEADSLLEDAFIHDIRHITVSDGFPQKDDRQTMLFSATVSDSVNQFAGEILRDDCAFISVNKNATNKRIKQEFVVVDEHEKCNTLYELLITEKNAAGGDVSKIRRTLVFVEAKRTSDMVAMYLSKKGIAAASINGDRGQHLREKALLDFRRKKVSVLVATDVCARGIDIPDLDHVINYDLPDKVVTYIHRVGRVGRIRLGFATSFVSPFGQDIPLLKEVKDMYCKNNTDVPENLVKLLESQSFSEPIEENSTEPRNDHTVIEMHNEIPDVSDF